MATTRRINYREEHEEAAQVFHGYAPPTSSTTYTPNQFFDVVLPHASRGCLRLVAYLIRKTLGWSDEEGNPQNPEAYVSYRELIDTAGVSRGAIKDAIQEALDKRYITCLRFGQPHRANEEGYSALYSLKWDEREQYVTDPEEFDGFFAGNGNLTHIPNDFFDYTIPNEPLAVIQVIGVIIRNTIGWQTKFGMRRQKIEMSFSEIMRRTGIGSRTTISNALKAAIDGYHIRRVERGVFDTNAGAESRATVYAIRWQDDEDSDRAKIEQPNLFDFDEGNGSKSGPGLSGSNSPSKTTVQKVDRSSTVQNLDRGVSPKSGPANGSASGPGTVQNVDSNEFKKRTDIKTTNLNNLPKQHQTAEPDVAVGGHSLSLLCGKLMAEGLEASTAKRLVENYPAERIERQIEWLPLRNVRTSKTGMLIRAIERDMPKPGASDAVRAATDEESFVEGFYEGWSNGKSEALVPASPSEIPTAVRLLNSAKAKIPEASPREIGRRFGRYCAGQQSEGKKPIASFVVQARNHGFAFVDGLAEKIRSEQIATYKKAREEHESAYREFYEQFLAQLASQFAEEHPATFAEFTEWEAEARAQIERKTQFGGEKMVARRLSFFDSEEAARERFVEFFSSRAATPILGFWEWDASINTNPFKLEKPV